MREINVASLNTLGHPFRGESLPARYKTIAQYVDRANLDFLQLQEVFSYANLYLMKHCLKTFPFSAYKKSFVGPKGGLATFSKVPLGEVDFSPYPNKWNLSVRSIANFISERGLLVVKPQECDFQLINTHLNSVSDGNWSESGRDFDTLLKQVRSFHEHLSKLSAKSSLTIISGDFNIAHNSPLYDLLVNYPSLMNIFAENKISTFHSEFLPKGSESHCIDYFFVLGGSNGWATESADYFLTNKIKLSNDKIGFASDHVGLKVKIKQN